MIEVRVAKLSKAQIAKMLKHQPFRIKKGNSDTVLLTESQVDKFDKNSRLGKAFTVKFGKEQVSAMKGSGLLGDIVGFINPTAGMLAKVVGLGVKPRRVRGRGSCKGNGIIGDLLSFGGKTLANFAIDKGSDYIKNKIKAIGTGRFRTATPKQRESLIRVRAKKHEKYLKQLEEGVRQPYKIRRKTGRKATPAQLAGLAKGRATRQRNIAARKGITGSALYAAGYR